MSTREDWERNIGEEGNFDEDRFSENRIVDAYPELLTTHYGFMYKFLVLGLYTLLCLVIQYTCQNTEGLYLMFFRYIIFSVISLVIFGIYCNYIIRIMELPYHLSTKRNQLICSSNKIKEFWKKKRFEIRFKILHENTKLPTSVISKCLDYN